MSPPKAPTAYKMTIPIPPGIESPDKVKTSLGTLNFFDGFLDKNTSKKLFDNLYFQRAVQAYLLALPPVSMVALREGLTQWGPANSTIPTFETLMDSRSLFLTANCNTPYTWMWINLHNGPLVAEIPPKVLGMINDLWFRYVTDLGIVGPDKGAGGNDLLSLVAGQRMKTARERRYGYERHENLVVFNLLMHYQSRIWNT